MQQRRELHTRHHDPSAIMLRSRHPFATRAIASLCGLLSVLCAAASAPILFIWVVDNTHPVSVAPLLLGGGLLLVAALLFVVRRLLQIGRTSRAVDGITHRPA